MTQNSLKDVIAYIAKTYPHKSDLSNARLTKMIYLADWHQAINHERQITDIEWRYDNYGPYVSDVKEEVKRNPDLLSFDETVNFRGNKKHLIGIKDDSYQPDLGDEQRESIDHIIKVTEKRDWGEFIQLVYSTHPIRTSERHSALNLVEKAREYTSEDDE